MKKAISLVLLFSCIFIIYQFGTNLIKKSHIISYNIKNEKDFKITETFKNNNYYFLIEAENYQFYYKDKNLFNKRKNIIKEIEYQEENGIMCIYPVYEKEASTILCSNKYNVYTQESSKNIKASNTLYSKLKNKGYTFKTDESNISNETESKDNVNYYQGNFNNKETLVLWKYDSFTIFNSDRSLNVYPLSFDRYENTMSTMISKYYITPLYIDNKLFEFSKLYIYDVISNKESELDLGMTLSNYTYINGIIDDKLYITDPSNVIQLEIEVKNKKVNIVGNKEKNGIYYDGKIHEKNIYDFVNNKITFKIDDSKLKNKYKYSSVYENQESYFYYTGEELYQVYKDKLDIPILIIKDNSLKQIKIKNDTIYFILNNTIYKYENNKPIKSLLTYNELIYNNSNMYDIYN